jgi:hypothetical protein
LTYDEFRIDFPEMLTASEPLVRRKLDQAAARLSEAILGAAYPEAHGSLTAHLIATAPGGQMARMVNKDGTTQYSRRLEEIKLAFVAGVLVA